MCLHLCCLNFPSTSSWTKSWSQSLLHVVVASFNSSLSHCYLIFTNFFLSISRTEPVLKHCSIAKCTSFPFQRVLIRPKLIPNKRVRPFYSSAAICSEFQNVQRPKFLPYLLVRVFKFIDLGCVGTGISWNF